MGFFISTGPLMLFPERLPKSYTDAAKKKVLEDELGPMINGKPISQEPQTKIDSKVYKIGWLHWYASYI